MDRSRRPQNTSAEPSASQKVALHPLFALRQPKPQLTRAEVREKAADLAVVPQADLAAASLQLSSKETPRATPKRKGSNSSSERPAKMARADSGSDPKNTSPSKRVEQFPGEGLVVENGAI